MLAAVDTAALTACPASRCTATNGTQAFQGLPVFDLFKGLGVLPSLAWGDKLNFTITALPKVGMLLDRGGCMHGGAGACPRVRTRNCKAVPAHCQSEGFARLMKF